MWPADACLNRLTALYRSSGTNKNSEAQPIVILEPNTHLFHGSVGNMPCDDINVFEKEPDYSSWMEIDERDPIIKKQQGIDISFPDLCGAVQSAIDRDETQSGSELVHVELSPSILEKLPKTCMYIYYVRIGDKYYTPLDAEDKYVDQSSLNPEERHKNIRTWDMSKLMFVTPDVEAAKVYIKKSPHRQYGQVLEFVTKERVKLLNLTNPEIVSTLGDQDAFIVRDGKVRRNSEYRKDYRLCQKLCKSEVDGFYYMPSDTRRFWENEIMFCRPDDVLRRVGI